MDAHLTFDASVSVTVTLNLDDLHRITGLRRDMLAAMQSHDIEELVGKLPKADLLRLGQLQFNSERNLVVNQADMELAVMEVY